MEVASRPDGSVAVPRALAVTFLANTVIMVCGVATGILAARLLLPVGRGQLAVVLFWPQLIAGFLFFSLNESVVYRVGTEPNRRDDVVATAARLALVLALFAVLAAYALIPWLLGPNRRSLWGLARFYAAVFLPLTFLTLVLLAGDQGCFRLPRYNLFRALTPILYLVGIIVVWATGMITVTAVALASAIAVLLVALLRLWPSLSIVRMSAGLQDARRLLRTGFRFHGATILLILTAQADRLVVIRVFEDAVVGYYMAAYALASVALGAITGSFHTVLFPQLARTRKQNQAALLARGVRSAMLALALIGAFVAALAPPLTRLLFGTAFAPAGSIARILTIAFALYALRETVVRSIRGLGDAVAGASAEAVSLILFFALSLPMAHEFGAAGIAVALLLANVLPLAILAHHLYRVYGVRPSELWGLNLRTIRDTSRLVRIGLEAGWFRIGMSRVSEEESPR